MMMELLKTAVKQPLKVNQLQLSAAFTPSFEAGFHVNMEGPKAAVRDGSVFEYCRLTDTVIQAWSVLQHGYFKGNAVTVTLTRKEWYQIYLAAGNDLP